MERVMRVRGRGRVEVAAYGIADAEHLVEKELAKQWPEARVEVLEVRRSDAERRIVEEFEVSYALHGELQVEAASQEAARSEAFRLARGRLTGSRYQRTEWEKAEPLPPHADEKPTA